MNRPTSSSDLGYLLLIGLVIGVVWLAILVWDWQRRRMSLQSPIQISLSNELMEAHRLTSRQIDRLHEIARLNSLEDPAILFVDPRPWELCAASPENVLSRDARELGQLLFGEEFNSTGTTSSPTTNEGITPVDGNRL